MTELLWKDDGTPEKRWWDSKKRWPNSEKEVGTLWKDDGTLRKMTEPREKMKTSKERWRDSEKRWLIPEKRWRHSEKRWRNSEKDDGTLRKDDGNVALSNQGSLVTQAFQNGQPNYDGVHQYFKETSTIIEIIWLYICHCRNLWSIYYEKEFESNHIVSTWRYIIHMQVLPNTGIIL